MAGTVTVTGGGVSNGTLINNLDGTFDYTPNAGFIGVDSFTYTVDDNGSATSNEATVTITVNPVATGAAVYRVNAGGSEITGTPGWETDTKASPSPYLGSGRGWSQIAATSNTISLSASVPAGTPPELFQSERWDPGGGQELQWEFPVTPGDYEVRLYFAETYSGTQGVGLRVFDVLAEGVVRLDDYDIFDAVGGYRGVMESFVVTSDETLDIDFVHVAENPAIKGIEIIQLGSAGQPLDVNQDATVSAVDALVIINQLSRVTAPEGEFGSARPTPYSLDVNRDDKVTAVDALMIINYLAQAETGGGLRAVSVPAAERQPVVANIEFSTNSDRDDSFDDILLLLAEDANRQLN